MSNLKRKKFNEIGGGGGGGGIVDPCLRHREYGCTLILGRWELYIDNLLQSIIFKSKKMCIFKNINIHIYNVMYSQHPHCVHLFLDRARENRRF